jgi:hypothetical protein
MTNQSSSRDETKIDTVLPLTLGDYERSTILRRSLDLFFRDLGTCWVVTPDNQLAALQSRIQHPKYRVIPESLIVPELRFYNVVRTIVGRTHRPTQGWAVQQLVKLAIAERIQTEFYLTLDADVICTKPVTCAQLVRDGRAICRQRRADSINEWPQWYDWAERVLGLPRSGINRGVTPALLSTTAVLELQAHLESRVAGRLRRFASILPERAYLRNLLVSWRSYLLRHLPWTEYSLYDTFVEATGLLGRYHSTDERTTISGNCVWYRATWPTWRPELSFTDRGDFFFSVLQSNARLSVDDVWEKVRPYLAPDGSGPRPTGQAGVADDVRRGAGRGSLP